MEIKTREESHLDDLSKIFVPFALFLVFTGTLFICFGLFQHKGSMNIDEHEVLLQIQDMDKFADMTQVVDVKRRLFSAKVLCSNYYGATEVFKVATSGDKYTIQHLPYYTWGDGW